MPLSLRMLCVGVVLFPAALVAQGTPRRFAADSLWRRIWVVGAKVGSDTFVEPRQVTVNRGVVTVLDAGTREIRGFDASTGAQRFVLAATGEGPGEFKRPALLFETPTGFAVLDQATARVTAYSPTAKALWDVVIPDVFRVADVCVSPAGRLLVAYQRRDSVVMVMDTTGRTLGVRRVPWRVPRETPVMFAHTAKLSAPSTSGACALALYLGREWATVSDVSGHMPVYEYIEPGPEPAIQEKTRVLERNLTNVIVAREEISSTNGIAKDALVRGDTVIVQGATTRDARYRMLDYYDIKTGKYLHSRKLPFILIGLTIDQHGTFYGTVIAENIQALVALRPERPSATAGAAKTTPLPTRRADTLARRSPPASVPPPTRR